MKSAIVASLALTLALTVPGSAWSAPTNEQVNDFIAAAGGNNVKQLTNLVAKGLSADLVSASGEVPLNIAAYWGAFDAVKYLVSQGANVNRLNNAGHSALYALGQTSGADRADIATYLLSQGAKFDLKDDQGRDAVWIAAYGGKIELLKTYLRAGASTETKNNDGLTLLMAAMDGNPKNLLEVVTFLLSAGANPKYKNAYGVGVVDWVARTFNPEVEKLIKSRQ